MAVCYEVEYYYYYGEIYYVQPFQCGDRFYTPEYDVCRRQFLPYKDAPSTERIKV